MCPKPSQCGYEMEQLRYVLTSLEIAIKLFEGSEKIIFPDWKMKFLLIFVIKEIQDED